MAAAAQPPAGACRRLAGPGDAAGAAVLIRRAAIALVGLGLADAAAAGAELRFEAGPGGPGAGTVGVFGLPGAALEEVRGPDLGAAAGREVLSVRTAAATDGGLPAVFGALCVEDGVVRFTPRFPFRARLTYCARFDGAAFDRLTAAAGWVELDFAVAPAVAQ